MKLDEAPGTAGYFVPPEWHQHRATWLSWPHNRSTWPGDFQSIFAGYLQFINEISRAELVCINVADRHMENSARTLLKAGNVNTKNIRFYHHPSNDAWCRDHGPSFMVNSKGKKVLVDWDYNAWGGKYPPFDLDNDIPSRIAHSTGLPYYRPGLVLEGGAVDFNGSGTMLTTSSCLLNPNRNPGMTKGLMETRLREVFGIIQVLWLDYGIAGDDTDGHIDTIARFVAPDTVVTVIEEDPEDENYRSLQENLSALKSMQLPDGKPLNVVTMPMPRLKFHRGQRLPATYANFYISNHAVLVPGYNDPNDQRAISVLAGLFQNRKIVRIDSSEIISGLGSLHCLCMQEPL